MKKGLALIGCGAIGSIIAKSIDEGIVQARLTLLYDSDFKKCEKLLSTLEREKPRIASSISEIVRDRETEVVVEAASQEAVIEYSKPILESGKTLVILSVGALLRKEVKPLLEMFREKIVIPPGAIGGLDIIETLKIVGIEKLELTSRKPLQALKDSIRGAVGDLKHAILIFEGSAEEAAKKFPKSMNIAATLKLTSNSPVHVKLLADPKVNRIVHEVTVYSKASKVRIIVENLPHPDNPRTSYLAALSAIETIKRLCKS